MDATTQQSWATIPTQRLTANGHTYAYRELGPTSSHQAGTPVVLLTHLAAVLDDWDPRIPDGLALGRRVIAFDNLGVGASTGTVPTTIEQMARDAVTFITALGLLQVDLVGMSMGGMVAQVIAEQQPHVVRRVVLAGTGPAGGKGITKVAPLTLWDTTRASVLRKNPKELLFFTRTHAGKSAAAAFVARLSDRTADRDTAIAPAAFVRQLIAITRWGRAPSRDLSGLAMPALVLNGDHDRMVPTSNTVDLARRLPASTLVIYPDAGHGALFQEHVDVLARLQTFLS